MELIIPAMANPGHSVVVNEDIGMETEEGEQEKNVKKKEKGKEEGEKYGKEELEREEEEEEEGKRNDVMVEYFLCIVK